jgi:hypothetical protein
MLLSRFWYVVLALVLGGATFVLYLATSMYNRAGKVGLDERLSSDSQLVSWYLREDARARSGYLVKFALEDDVSRYLNASSKSEGKVPAQARSKVEAALSRVNKTIPTDQAFDAVFAVDQHGRVVAHVGYEQASGLDDFELGGYPVVADALHGYVRDDTLVLDRLYRVVARPVEHDLGQMPAGAIVGARIIDDRFARELSERTGAAVAFYANGQRASSGSPEGFDRSQLDQIVGDLGDLEKDSEYREKGRSKARTIGNMLTVQYTRLPGEAWALGAGYAVARLPHHVDGPLGFFSNADDRDKEQANIWLAIGLAVAAAFLGVLFSVLEHTLPLRRFRAEAQRLAKGETDQLQPSKFRGVYRKVASDLNDGMDHVAAKGGAPRRAADFKQVLGDIPDQPQMSAFNFPGDQAPASAPSVESTPQMPSAAEPPSTPAKRALPSPPVRRGAAPAAGVPEQPGPPASGEGAGAPSEGRAGFEGWGQGSSEEQEWAEVYQEFVATKQQCGENVEGFTFEKFQQTLRRNRDSLMSRHGAKRVKFSVYVKDGKAALKANPLKE